MAVRKGASQPRRVITTLGTGIPDGYLELIASLIEIRIAKGMSSKALAERLGVDQKTLWGWEHPKTHDPRFVHVLDLVRWAEALDVKVTVR